jgi:hypothetical protein
MEIERDDVFVCAVFLSHGCDAGGAVTRIKFSFIHPETGTETDKTGAQKPAHKNGDQNHGRVL